MSRILVTGASGFVGGFVVRQLSRLHHVYGIARDNGGDSNSNVELINADLASIDCRTQLPHGIDCVIHLAQSKEYRNFPLGSVDMRLINIDATCKLLEWARMTGVRQFIFSSTANVYQKSTELLTEIHPTAPDSFYGATKLSAEHLIKQYQQFFHVDILRLFTVYGPGQHGMLIPNTFSKILAKRPIALAEGVGIYISPVFVEDVVDVIQHLIDTACGPGIRLMNVCGDQVASLTDIVKILEKLIGKLAVFQVTDGESTSFTGSNRRLKDYLEYHQFVDIQAGLERTFQSYKMLI